MPRLLDGSRVYDLGDVGYAAGDPSALAFDSRGNLIIALAGVNEIAITASPAKGRGGSSWEAGRRRWHRAQMDRLSTSPTV